MYLRELFRKKRHLILCINVFLNTLIGENYINNKPHSGINRVNYHPNKVKYENRNRQRKNRDRNRNRKRRKDLRFEEIRRIQNESSCLRKSQKTRQIKLDQWGACNTPKVWRSIVMVSTPRDNKEKIKLSIMLKKANKIRKITT